MTTIHTPTIIRYIAFGLAAYLLIFWLVDYAPLNLPEDIPGLNLKLYGILIMIAFIILFVFFQKALLKTETDIPVWKLIMLTTIVTLASSLLYQTIRQLVVLRGQYNYNIASVFLSTLLSTALLIFVATSIAFELKKVKGFWRQVPMLVLLIILFLIKQYPTHLEW